MSDVGEREDVSIVGLPTPSVSNAQGCREKPGPFRELGDPEERSCTSSRSVSGLHLPGVLKWGDSQSRQAPVNAFVDSGAAENFLDLSWALKLQLPIELNPSPRMVQSIDGETY